MNFKNKTVLLTGATSALGQEIALHLSKTGAKMILHYNNSNTKMQALEEILKENRCEYKVIKADFSNRDEINRMIKKLKESTCSIDILINNAAIEVEKFIINVDESDFEKLLDINLKSPYFLIKHILRLMIARRNGCIINISSSVIKRSKSKESLYGMSKGGLEAITKILAKEVGNYNIRVNAIAPGPFYSQMNELDMEAVEMIKQINAIPRLVTLNEIANVVLFLCSDFSSAITGQIISVDNGFSI